MSPEFRGALALRVCSTTRYQLFRRAGASGPMPGVKPASRPCVKKGRCRSRLSVLPGGWSSMTEFRRDRDVDLAGSFQHVGLPHHIQFACDCGQPIAGTPAASLSNQALIVNERRQTALQSSMRQGASAACPRCERTTFGELGRCAEDRVDFVAGNLFWHESSFVAQ